jgi:hypothetical protein
VRRAVRLQLPQAKLPEEPPELFVGPILRRKPMPDHVAVLGDWALSVRLDPSKARQECISEVWILGMPAPVTLDGREPNDYLLSVARGLGVAYFLSDRAEVMHPHVFALPLLLTFG